MAHADCFAKVGARPGRNRHWVQTRWTRADIELANGLRIAVFRAGRSDGDAPTLLLVHGLGHWTEAAWDALAPHLGDHYRLLAFDLPGFGESDRPDLAYDLGFFTDTVAQVVERTGLARFGLVGHSLGGLIAASYAAREPGRVTSLALIDPAGFRRTARLMLFAAAGRMARFSARVRPSPSFVRNLLHGAVYDPAAISEAVHERALLLAADPAFVRAFIRVYRDSVGDLVALRRLHERLARYRGPVSLFWGRHDRYVPIAALAGARRVYPHADVTVFERSAHMPNVEEPGALAARLIRCQAGADLEVGSESTSR